MSKDEIIFGVDLAYKALQFAMFSNGKVTCADCRKAILIIFPITLFPRIKSHRGLKFITPVGAGSFGQILPVIAADAGNAEAR